MKTQDRRLLVGMLTRHNENSELECPWIEESTDSLKASTFAEVTQSLGGLLHGDQS